MVLADSYGGHLASDRAGTGRERTNGAAAVVLKSEHSLGSQPDTATETLYPRTAPVPSSSTTTALVAATRQSIVNIGPDQDRIRVWLVVVVAVNANATAAAAGWLYYNAPAIATVVVFCSCARASGEPVRCLRVWPTEQAAVNSGKGWLVRT